MKKSTSSLQESVDENIFYEKVIEKFNISSFDGIEGVSNEELVIVSLFLGFVNNINYRIKDIAKLIKKDELYVETVIRNFNLKYKYDMGKYLISIGKEKKIGRLFRSK